MKKYGSIIINTLLVIFGLIGLYYTFFENGQFMDNDAILYYTVQSNIFVIVIAAFSLIFEGRKLTGKTIPLWFYTIRFIGAVAITLTFLVFSLMLTPVLIAEGSGSYILTIGNACVHNLVPLCAIFDWIFFGHSTHLKRKQFCFALLPALYYVIFALTRSFMGLTIGGDHVPYFFMDYKKLGWLKISGAGIGVVYWIVILLFALLGMCAFFKKFCRNK